jgi:hypothetical protein
MAGETAKRQAAGAAAPAMGLHAAALVAIMHDHRTVSSLLPELVAGGVDAVIVNLDIDIDLSDPRGPSRFQTAGYTASAEAALGPRQRGRA